MKCLNHAFAILLLCLSFQVQAANIHIAAAANLRFVLPELIEKFEQQTGKHAMVSYAASGTLTAQILHDAPFDIFLSASPQYIQRLTEAQLTKDDPVNYAKAQLALFVPNDSKFNINDGLQGLTLALEHGVLSRVAIANPKHAPYGKIAKKELQNAGVWKNIQPHLIIAENALQAVQFTLTSSVDAGLIPYSHAIHPKFLHQGQNIKLEETLQQQAVLLKRSPESAKEFLLFLQQKFSRDVFLKHGFL